MKFYKFYADWCGPCKVLTTNLKRAGVEYEEVNVDEREDLCMAYNIRNIPVFIAVREENGVEQEIDRFVGIKSPDGIKQWIDNLKDE